MAIFTGLARFTSDDFTNTPDWFKRAIALFNPVVDTLNQTLANGIDTTNNVLCERKQVNIAHDTPTSILMTGALGQSSTQPKFVRAGFASGETVVGCSITGYDSTGLNPIVTVLFDSGTTEAVSVWLLFEP